MVIFLSECYESLTVEKAFASTIEKLASFAASGDLWKRRSPMTENEWYLLLVERSPAESRSCQGEQDHDFLSLHLIQVIVTRTRHSGLISLTVIGPSHLRKA
jgi:hypothetical protein